MTAITLGVGIALAGLLAFDPASGGLFPPCPWLWLTGWQCPGCGVLRGTHALLHGEIGEAWRLNPLWLLLAPLLGAALVWATARSFGVPLPVWRVPRAGLWGMLLAVVAFGVLRNL